MRLSAKLRRSRAGRPKQPVQPVRERRLEKRKCVVVQEFDTLRASVAPVRALGALLRSEVLLSNTPFTTRKRFSVFHCNMKQIEQVEVGVFPEKTSVPSGRCAETGRGETAQESAPSSVRTDTDETGTGVGFPRGRLGFRCCRRVEQTVRLLFLSTSSTGNLTLPWNLIEQQKDTRIITTSRLCILQEGHSQVGGHQLMSKDETNTNDP